MASTIILKNGTGSAVPSSLTHGELAINVDNGALFYGTSGSSNAVSSSFLFSHISSSTITASSHISTSGNVYGTRGVFVSRVQTPAIRNAEGALAITSDDGPIVAEGNITASATVTAGGHISASGDIAASTFTIGGKGLANFASDTLQHGFDSSLKKYTYGKDSDNEHLFYGDITASGNISASTTSTASFGYIKADTLLLNYIGSIDAVDSSGNTTDNVLLNVADSGFTIGNTDNVLQLNGSTIDIDSDGTLDLISDTGLIQFKKSTAVVCALDITSQTLLKPTLSMSIMPGSGVHGFAKVKIGSVGGSETITLDGQAGSASFAGDIDSLNIITNEVSASNLIVTGSEGNITASGDVSASGNIIGTDITVADELFIKDDIIRTGDTDPYIRLSSDFKVEIGDVSGTGNETILTVDNPNAKISTTHQLDVTGNITSSGNISASGIIYSDVLDVNTISSSKIILDSEIIHHNDPDTKIGFSGADTFDVTTGNAIQLRVTPAGTTFNSGHVTASGNISASGNVIAKEIIVNRIDGGNPALQVYHATENLLAQFESGDAQALIEFKDNSTTDSVLMGAIGDDISLRTDAGSFQLQMANNVVTALAITGSNGRATFYGDISGGRDLMIADVTASGGITASGDIIGLNLTATGSTGTVSGVSGSFEVLTGTGDTPGLEVEGYISASNSEVLGTTGSFSTMTKAFDSYNFYYSVNSSTEMYIPIMGSGQEQTFPAYYHLLIAPYDGMVKRVSIAWQTQNPANFVVRTRVASSPGLDINDDADIVEAVSQSAGVDDTSYILDFSSSFDKGDAVCITVQQNGTSGSSAVAGVFAVEYDLTS
tara:strand:- start:2322 stop:4817 length:2496 start_codon:yes stop_codon:yes gene_type:complete